MTAGTEEGDDEGEEVPDFLEGLSPEEQQARVKVHASWLLFTGVLARGAWRAVYACAW